MCTTTALETALRSCIRIGDDGCAALAVNINEHFAEGSQTCNDEPISTRLTRCIKEGRLLAQLGTDGPTVASVSCGNMPAPTELLGLFIYPSSEGRCVIAMHDISIADPGCAQVCGQPLGLAQALAASAIFNGYWDPNPCAAVIDVDGYEPLNCDNHTPLETLLRMCAAIMPDGSVAWRIQIEV